MATFWELVDQAIAADPAGDPTEMAERLVAKMGRPERLLLLSRHIQHLQRGRSALLEQSAFRKRLSDAVTFARPLTPEICKVLRTRVALGDGVALPFGALTVEQHELRMEMLVRMRDGIGETIERHRTAIAIIVDAGVTCLDDLDECEDVA